MGPAEKKPPFPELPWTKLPKSHPYLAKFRLECNYLQATEGDYDPEHPRFLHSTLSDGALLDPLGERPGGAPNAGSQNQQAEPFPKAVGKRRVTPENVQRIRKRVSRSVSKTTCNRR